MLNEAEVHTGFTQYNAGTVEQWCSEIEDLEPTTDIVISGFRCSSTFALNAVLDDLVRTIDKEQGLKSLMISEFNDLNSLQEWPLSQLAIKCSLLVKLTIDSLNTTDENRSQLLEFAGMVAVSSNCL